MAEPVPGKRPADAADRLGRSELAWLWGRCLKNRTRRSLQDTRRIRRQCEIPILHGSASRSGVAASTSKKEVRVLRRIFSSAILHRRLPQRQDSCPGLPVLRTAAKWPPHVNSDEFERIYGQAADTLWRSLPVVMYTTGFRYREAMNLLWRDVDFESGQLHVTRRPAGGDGSGVDTQGRG